MSDAENSTSFPHTTLAVGAFLSRLEMNRRYKWYERLVTSQTCTKREEASISYYHEDSLRIPLCDLVKPIRTLTISIPERMGAN